MKRYMWLVGSVFLLLPLLFFHSTSALFTKQMNDPNNTFQTGTLDMAISPSAVFNISNMVPGDFATKTVTVQNTGSVDFTYVVGAINTGNTNLWTDKTYGLQVEIKKGVTTYYSGPVSDVSANPASPLSLSVGQNDVLTIKVTLPTLADNTFQTLTEVITFTFQATQLPGQDRS
ncbi:TasA family protein [Priestia koreensis]|uniref:TasA family protein n=1 Tax=Priestia koreensis TaxID=284581 RepID=UPI00345B4A88